jgi:hypothetical protein
MSQVLAIQHVAPERQRGVATSLVPFFRAVGGSLGVGLLGGVFAAGVAARLGSGLDAASRLLAGQHPAAGATLSPGLFRQSIERSLLPVFAAMLALAAANLAIASRFPETGDEETVARPAEEIA